MCADFFSFKNLHCLLSAKCVVSKGTRRFVSLRLLVWSRCRNMRQKTWVDSGGSSLGKEGSNTKSIFNTAALSSRKLQPPKPGRSVPGVHILLVVLQEYIKLNLDRKCLIQNVYTCRQQLQELRLKQEQKEREKKGSRKQDLQGESAGERAKPRRILPPHQNPNAVSHSLVFICVLLIMHCLLQVCLVD